MPLQNLSNPNRTGEIQSLVHSIGQVMMAKEKREERERLAEEARAKLKEQFGDLDETALEVKWRETEELAQLFREAFYSGENGYCRRIIDKVWEGVAGAKVNIDRDRIDNMGYTGGHLKALAEAGITPEQYEQKLVELCKEYHELTGKKI